MPLKRSWLALGCGAYLAFAFLTLPAATAYRWLAPQTVVLSGISGTAWAGRAELASVAGLPLQNLEWNIAKLPLLVGRLSADVSTRLADGFLRTSSSATLQTLSFTDFELTTTLESLRGWLPLEGARGAVSAAFDELTLRERWPAEVAGTVTIRDLEVAPVVPGLGAAAAGTLVPLGSYELSSFAISDARLAAQLRDTGGPLEVTGIVALSLQAPATLAGAVPTFDGRVRERAGLPPTLREPLDFLTVDIDGNGWRTLDLNPWLRQL